MTNKQKKLAACLVAFAASLLVGCDPERHKKCEWYLIPEPEDLAKVDTGMVPICVRNFVNNKQRCRMQVNFDFAKKNFNRKFRFVDLEVDQDGKFPRTIRSVTFCE